MMNINPHIVYSIIIFIILICCFYMIINNFGTSNLALNNQPSSNSVHQTINNLQQELANVKSEISQTKNDSDPQITITTNSDPSGQSGQTVIKPPPVIFDPIANYDQAKLLDPLVDPRGRTSADQIPAPQVAAQFNFPTQGVLDRYHRVGLLIAIDTPYDNNDFKGKRPRRRHAKNVLTDIPILLTIYLTIQPIQPIHQIPLVQ